MPRSQVAKISTRTKDMQTDSEARCTNHDFTTFYLDLAEQLERYRSMAKPDSKEHQTNNNVRKLRF
jgi:hypothetical protein